MSTERLTSSPPFELHRSSPACDWSFFARFAAESARSSTKPRFQVFDTIVVATLPSGLGSRDSGARAELCWRLRAAGLAELGRAGASGSFAVVFDLAGSVFTSTEQLCTYLRDLAAVLRLGRHNYVAHLRTQLSEQLDRARGGTVRAS